MENKQKQEVRFYNWYSRSKPVITQEQAEKDCDVLLERYKQKRLNKKLKKAFENE